VACLRILAAGSAAILSLKASLAWSGVRRPSPVARYRLHPGVDAESKRSLKNKGETRMPKACERCSLFLKVTAFLLPSRSSAVVYSGMPCERQQNGRFFQKLILVFCLKS
jgi:hypothetical protein